MRISRFSIRLGDNAFFRIEFPNAVVQNRIFFGYFVTGAFASHHVQKLRAVQLFDVVQRGNQDIQIVTVDRANIIKSEFFE